MNDKPKKKRVGKPSAYDTVIQPNLELIKHKIREGVHELKIAELLGISSTTHYKYKAEKTEYAEALKENREQALARWESQLEKNIRNGKEASLFVALKAYHPEKYDDKYRERLAYQQLLKEDKPFEVPARLMGKSFVDIYRDIRQGLHREYVLKGGRLSLKSTTLSEIIPELIMNNPGTHCLVVRPYENTLRDSVYSQFLWALSEMGIADKWNATTSPMQIVYIPTGQTIYFRGADDPSKIRSIKPKFGHIAYLWFEELDQFRGEEQIRDVTQSAMRGGEIGMVFKSFNPPRSRANWANKYAMTPKANMLVHHSSYKEAPPQWLGQFALEEAESLRQINEKAWLHEYMGEVIGDGGNVFENIIPRDITDEEIAKFDTNYYGQDWGYYPDPNILVGMYYDSSKRDLYVFEEEVGWKMGSEEWEMHIRRFKDEIITADPAEKKSIADLRTFGYMMYEAIKGPGSVHEGLKWLASLSHIYIDAKRCPTSFKEFIGYEYDRDKDGNVITGYPDKDNHSIDAVRYAMERVWRRRGQ